MQLKNHLRWLKKLLIITSDDLIDVHDKLKNILS